MIAPTIFLLSSKYRRYTESVSLNCQVSALMRYDNTSQTKNSGSLELRVKMNEQL